MSESEPAPSPSLSQIARKGSVWMSAQALLNKIASAASMLVVADALTPPELGLGQLAVSIVNFLTVLPPIVMCDVLVAHQSRLSSIIRRGAGIAAFVGLATAIVLSAASPLVAGFFPEYPSTELALLVSALGFRALANALGTTAVARLRSELRYRSIVAIDGGVQLGSTILTLGLAVAGAGASSIVLPYLVGSIVRSAMYARLARSTPVRDVVHADGQTATGDTPPPALARSFAFAALAQYVHTAVGALPMLALGVFSDELQTGLYGFASLLAIQATTVIAFQLGIVLQPVFGRLGHDPARQVAAYIRAIRTLGFVSVPLSVMQAAFAAPLFGIFFSPKWDGALATFQILSIAQCFQFGLAPTLAVIKAQARFRVTLAWQAVHLVVGAAAMAAVARAGTTTMAATVTILWAISVPAASWLAGRPAGLPLRTCIRAFIEPWIVTLPIGVAAWAAAEALTPLGTAARLASLLLGGPLAVYCVLFLTRRIHPEIFVAMTELGPLRVLGRLFPRGSVAATSPAGRG